MDAVSRAFEFPNYPAQEPSTKVVNVMSKQQCDFYISSGKVSDMIVWLHRPEQLHSLKYADFYKIWHYTFKKPTKNSTESYELKISNIKKTKFRHFK